LVSHFNVMVDPSEEGQISGFWTLCWVGYRIFEDVSLKNK
jgi:hypothetical protein